MGFSFSKHFEAYVIAAFFDELDAPIVILSDGRVVFLDSQSEVLAHPNATIISACLHPSGLGVITGGDDGRVVWTASDTGVTVLFTQKNLWIETLKASQKSMVIAFSSGKKAYVIDLKAPQIPTVFSHDYSVAELCFDPSGRKLYCATYNGVMVWFTRIKEQIAQKMTWAGSHTKIACSPDGKFLMTAMQDNALHGWRLSDAKDMRMGGYPAKIRDLCFFYKGKLLATSGANGAVVWPFLKSNGPMGEEASEINAVPESIVSSVFGASDISLLASGLDDGRVWLGDLQTTGVEWIKAEKGAPITALRLNSTHDRLIIGDEDGFVYIYEASDEDEPEDTV
jgi:WD40 repeat protein